MCLKIVSFITVLLLLYCIKKLLLYLLWFDVSASDEFRCTSGECIDTFSVCNGTKECADAVSYTHLVITRQMFCEPKSSFETILSPWYPDRRIKNNNNTFLNRVIVMAQYLASWLYCTGPWYIQEHTKVKIFRDTNENCNDEKWEQNRLVKLFFYLYAKKR